METQNNQNQPTYGPMNSSSITSKPPQHHSYRMIMITVLVILLGIAGYVVLSNPDLKNQVKTKLNLMEAPGESATDTQELSLFASEITNRNDAWMEVRSTSGAVAKVGKPLQIAIHGFSAGKEITGYDMLLGIDTEAFDIVSVTSTAPGFQIFDFDKGVYHSVTGIKDLQAKDSSRFDDTQLITVELVPKRAGSSVITILSTKGQEKTQLVYEEGTEVKSVVPQIGSMLLEISE